MKTKPSPSHARVVPLSSPEPLEARIAMGLDCGRRGGTAVDVGRDCDVEAVCFQITSPLLYVKLSPFGFIPVPPHRPNAPNPAPPPPPPPPPPQGH